MYRDEKQQEKNKQVTDKLWKNKYFKDYQNKKTIMG